MILEPNHGKRGSRKVKPSHALVKERLAIA